MIQKENADNSLDNVMQDLFKVSKQQKFSSGLFKEIARKYIPKGIDSEISSFIDNGNIISLINVNLPIEKVIIGRYDLGLNKDIMIKDKIIREIDVKSNAYNVGLRNGQEIIAFSFPKGWGNANQIVTIKTTDGVFKFKPEHYDKKDVYQIKANMSTKEKKQFNKFFALAFLIIPF